MSRAALELARDALGHPTLVQALDETVLRALRDTPRPLVWLFFGFTLLGNGWGLLVALPFALRPATRRAVAWLFASQLAVSAVGSLLKAIVGRSRPCDALSWCSAVLVDSPGGGSFPSGHAAGAFAFAAFATTLDARLAIPAFPIAALIASSRCVLGVHYPSDVLAGAALGLLLGYGFARLCRRAERGPGGETAADVALPPEGQ